MSRPPRVNRVRVLLFHCLLVFSFGSQNSNVVTIQSGSHTEMQALQPAMPSPSLYLPLIMRKWPPVLIFSDEFDGDHLDPYKWIIKKGTITVANGKLILPDAEVQSILTFTYGILQMKIESSAWKPTNNIPFTDSTFGFEYWYGSCHSGAMAKANGHLAVLKQSPCPFNESYPPLLGWDSVMPGVSQTLFVTLTWLPTGETLLVSNGNSYTETITDTLTPTVPLSIRLNSTWNEPHAPETYIIDYVRVYEDP
jgi:hypothetical protein